MTPSRANISAPAAASPSAPPRAPIPPVDGGEPIERRPFVVRFLAGAIGAVVGLVPLVAGAIVFFLGAVVLGLAGRSRLAASGGA